MIRLVGYVLFLTLCIFGIQKCIIVSRNSIKAQAVMKSRIGQRIILEKDTLLILDYSLINSNYKLSSGQEINFDLVDKLQIIK